MRRFFLLMISIVMVSISGLQISNADIYQWEWVDPGDLLLGRQQSATLVPDGAGHVAEPQAGLAGLDLYESEVGVAFFLPSTFAK